MVLAEALADDRVLLTCDKDFGELVFRRGRHATRGVILVRLATKSQMEFPDFVLPLLEAQEASWPGHFSVIARRRARVKPLP